MRHAAHSSSKEFEFKQQRQTKRAYTAWRGFLESAQACSIEPYTTNQPTNQPTSNQPTSNQAQLTKHSTSQPTNQTQLTKNSTSQPTNQPIKHSTSLKTHRPTIQSANQIIFF